MQRIRKFTVSLAFCLADAQDIFWRTCVPTARSTRLSWCGVSMRCQQKAGHCLVAPSNHAIGRAPTAALRALSKNRGKEETEAPASAPLMPPTNRLLSRAAAEGDDAISRAVSGHGQFRGWFNQCWRACIRMRSTRQAAGQSLKRIPVRNSSHATINIRPLGQVNAFLGYFLSLGQEVTRRPRRRNSRACQERQASHNRSPPAGYAPPHPVSIQNIHRPPLLHHATPATLARDECRMKSDSPCGHRMPRNRGVSRLTP